MLLYSKLSLAQGHNCGASSEDQILYSSNDQPYAEIPRSQKHVDQSQNLKITESISISTNTFNMFNKNSLLLSYIELV